MTQRERTGLKVLVTGARLPAALEIIRALHADGADVWAGDSLYITPAGVSRYVTGYLRFPSPVFSFTDFKNFFCEIVHRLGIELIVPVSEEIFFLAQIIEDLSPTILFAPSLQELRMLHSKWEILAKAKDCGIRLPQTMRATSTSELRKALKRIPDGILKPEFSRGSFETYFPPHYDVTRCNISENYPWLVQEKLRGRELSTYCVAYEGRVLAQTIYEPLYRVRSGASLYFRPLSSPAIEAFVTTFVKKNTITGQLSFDVMEESHESLALLECNPRPTSGVHLFPTGCHWGRAFWGAEIVGRSGHSSDRAAKLAVIALHFFPALRARQWRAFFSDLLKARDNSFLANDPAPFFALHLSAFEIFWRSRSWSVPAHHAYIFDLEWNG